VECPRRVVRIGAKSVALEGKIGPGPGREKWRGMRTDQAVPGDERAEQSNWRGRGKKELGGCVLLPPLFSLVLWRIKNSRGKKEKGRTRRNTVGTGETRETIE